MIDQLEALEKHAKYQDCLLHGKLTTDAGPLPVTKGFIGVGRPALFGLDCEMIGVERLSILAPDAFIAVQHGNENGPIFLIRDLIFTTNRGALLIGIEGKHRRSWPEP